MENQIGKEQELLDENQFLRQLEQEGSFEILPCENAVNLEDSNRYNRLKLEPVQKMQLSALVQQLPTAAAAKTLNQTYVVKFPEGLPYTLTKLKQGGYGTQLKWENGRFAGSTSLYPTEAPIAMLNVFGVMSIATSQYFLTQINKEMRMMTMKLDEILNFLYGDKKAELIAEMTLIRSFYENYGSMMAHEQQRQATIISLQNARKTAIQDIEFYVNDLERVVSGSVKGYSELESRARKAFQVKDSLILAQQLYAMSNMMEVYFAQNYDSSYLQSMEREVIAYLDKCDKRILGSFSTLKGRIDGYKTTLMEKVDKTIPQKKIEALIEFLTNREEDPMRQSIRSSLHSLTESAEFYLTQEGQLYLKK